MQADALAVDLDCIAIDDGRGARNRLRGGGGGEEEKRGDKEYLDHATVLTDPGLPSGSDRIRAAVDAIDPEGDFDAVINVQGDMPFASPGLATACAAVLHGEPACDIATLVAAEADPSDRTNPDVVKAVLALGDAERQGRALYFTRSTLYGETPIWRHIGVYGYRRDALNRFCAAPQSPLERREKLEQLRALEMGMQIWAAVIDEAPLSVDNPADLEAARRIAAG